MVDICANSWHNQPQINLGFIIPPANFVCGGYTVFTLSIHASVRVSVIPPANFVCGGYTFSRCLSVRPSVCPSVRNVLFP